LEIWDKKVSFRGYSYHNIDTKGRVIIPARFKEPIKDGERSGVMVSKLDGALVAYPFDEWEKVEQKILYQTTKDDDLRLFRRFFIGGAFECFCDKQDRILIPPPLRKYADLNKEIVLVGVVDHFEIWSRENWVNEDARFEQNRDKPEVKNIIAGIGL
jgi:MraZ protein